jgi:hypothetical protein
MQSVILRPGDTRYHHRLHSHDGTFHLNFGEIQRGGITRPNKGDHWHLCVSSPLNDLLVSCCRSWRHTNRPIVASRPTAWPLIARIDMRDATVFDMMAPESMERLHAYVRKNGTPSCFGMIRDASGAADRYDERIRQSLEISADKIIAIRDTDLYKMATRLLRFHWGLDKCSLRFYKLLMYDADDKSHFEFHRDAVHDENHLGTLVIALESPDCRGGRVLFKDFDDDEVVHTADYRLQDMLKMYIFYTDTEHRVEQVTRGYRVILQYEIMVDQLDEVECAPEPDKFHYDTDVTNLFPEVCSSMGAVDDEPSSPITLRTIDLFSERVVDEKLCEQICVYLKNASVTHVPALMMSHLYPIANIEPDTLRGFDRLMYKVLDPHFDIEFMPVVLFGDDRGNIVTRCVSMHRNRHHHDKRDLMLYVTPTAVHCSEVLSGSYQGGTDHPQPHLHYTAVAMILNKINKL